MSSCELRDSRGRKVLGTVAKSGDGEICVLCTMCDGEFVNFDKFKLHISEWHYRTMDTRQQPAKTIADKLKSEVRRDANYNHVGPSHPKLSAAKVASGPAVARSATAAESLDGSAARTRILKRPLSRIRIVSSRAAKKLGPIEIDSDAETDADEAQRPKRPCKEQAKDKIRQNLSNEESDEYDYFDNRCKYCGKPFKTLQQTNEHTLQCDEWLNLFGEFECECGKTVKTEHELKVHQETEHSKARN